MIIVDIPISKKFHESGMHSRIPPRRRLIIEVNSFIIGSIVRGLSYIYIQRCIIQRNYTSLLAKRTSHAQETSG